VIVDVFNHFMPKAYLDRLAKVVPDHIAVTAFPRIKPLVDVDARLRLLDQFDDLRQIISLANPPLELVAPPAQSPELARLANDTLADVCRSHPDRFPSFVASLPMNNIDASVAEIDRAITQLGARGVQVFTNVAGKPLSAPEFRPIFKTMVEHDLPVWVHPMRGPQFSDYASETVSANEIWFSFGWPYETTACMTRLIFSGIFDELPTLKIISHHMGGMIPYFAGKIKLGFKQIFFRRSAASRSRQSSISRCSMPIRRWARRRPRAADTPSLAPSTACSPPTRRSMPSKGAGSSPTRCARCRRSRSPQLNASRFSPAMREPC
jgi:uncharacterized protein